MAVSGVIAVVAIIAGIIFAFWPVIPGFVFVLFGLALLSAQSIRIARALDRVELTGWRLIRRRLRKNDGAP